MALQSLSDECLSVFVTARVIVINVKPDRGMDPDLAARKWKKINYSGTWTSFKFVRINIIFFLWERKICNSLQLQKYFLKIHKKIEMQWRMEILMLVNHWLILKSYDKDGILTESNENVRHLSDPLTIWSVLACAFNLFVYTKTMSVFKVFTVGAIPYGPYDSYDPSK